MGFVIPGIDSLRFTVAPTGTGDVHVRVSSRDGSSHDDAGEDDDATTRLSRIPPATHLYPLDPNPPWTRSSASAPPNARARERRRCTRARRRRDRRPTGGRAPPPRPAPSRLGTLRPEDHRGAHPPAPRPRDRRRRVGPSRRQPRATRTLHKPRNPRPRSDGARWRWTTPARRGTHPAARASTGRVRPISCADPSPTSRSRRAAPGGDRRRGGVGRTRGVRATRQRRLARRVRGWRILRHPPGSTPRRGRIRPRRRRRTGTSITIAIAPRR